MNKFIESIINKDYLAAEKEFQKEISERVNDSIENIKQEISESLLESTSQDAYVVYDHNSGEVHSRHKTLESAKKARPQGYVVGSHHPKHPNNVHRVDIGINPDDEEKEISESLLESADSKSNFKVYYTSPEGKDHTTVLKADSHSHAKRLIHKFAGSDVKITDSKQLNEEESLDEAKKYMEEMKDANKNGVCDDKEQIDEISKKTLGSYVSNASNDIATRVAYDTYDLDHDKVDNRRSFIHRAVDKIAGEDKKKQSTAERLKRHVDTALNHAEAMADFEPGSRHKARTSLTNVKKAADKLTEEQIDEISKKTLGRYVKGAHFDIENRKKDSDDLRSAENAVSSLRVRGTQKFLDKNYKQTPSGEKLSDAENELRLSRWDNEKKLDNRKAGVHKAMKKLTEGFGNNPKGSRSILSASRDLHDKSKSSIDDINSTWNTGKHTVHVIYKTDGAEDKQIHKFLFGSGHDTEKEGNFNAHHDQTGRNLGNHEIVNRMHFTDGKMVHKDNDIGVGKSLPLYVYK